MQRSLYLNSYAMYSSVFLVFRSRTQRAYLYWPTHIYTSVDSTKNVRKKSITDDKN